MNLEVITAPPFYPVTLAQCYSHLRLDPSDSPPTHPDDAMLETHIATATGEAEKYTRRAFIRQSLRLHVSSFPGPDRGIKLLRPPLRSIESVKYYDGDNALQTLDQANYYTSVDAIPQVRFVSTFAAPTIYRRPDAVRIDYTVGYEPVDSPPTLQEDFAANVPAEFQAAILIGVQLLYDQLSPDQRDKLERARDSLLYPSRIMLTA
jgi:uncharacterized phiE125 gp8 family phage protein